MGTDVIRLFYKSRCWTPNVCPAPHREVMGEARLHSSVCSKRPAHRWPPAPVTRAWDVAAKNIRELLSCCSKPSTVLRTGDPRGARVRPHLRSGAQCWGETWANGD